MVAALPQTHPFREVLGRGNLLPLCSSILTPMLYGGGDYLTVIWMPIYMDTLINSPVRHASWVNLVSNIFGLSLVSLLTGWLSDRWGRRPIMLFGAVSVGATAPLLMIIISRGETVQAQFSRLCIAVLLAFYCGPFPSWLVETFPAKVRLTSASLGFNLGVCLSSGFAPAIATALVNSLGSGAPGFIYPVLSVFGIAGMLLSSQVHQDGGIEEETSQETRYLEDNLNEHLL